MNAYTNHLEMDLYAQLVSSEKSLQATQLANSYLDTLLLISDSEDKPRSSDLPATELLTVFAPVGLIDGASLLGLCSAKNSESEFAALSLELLSDLVRDDFIDSSSAQQFRIALELNRISLPEVGSPEFYTVGIPTEGFRLGSLGLCLAQNHESHIEELIGHLQYRFRGSLFESLSSVLPSRWFSASDKALARLDEFVATEKLDPKRIERGFNLTGLLVGECIDAACELADRSRPTNKMLDLVADKASWARGYHPGKKLKGCPLDELFDDPNDLVAKLAESRWIQSGSSKDSRFLNELTSFRGPMFRVFSPSELTTIQDWINNLGSEPSVSNNPSIRDKDHAVNQSSKSSTSRSYEGMGYNQLFYYLINYQDHPDVVPFAHDFAAKWTQNARKGLDKGELKIPFRPYTPNGLDTWVDDRHRYQVDSYKPLSGAPSKSREEFIHETVQLAPMILIDGAWVEHMLGPSSLTDPVCRHMHRIYVDEVGNGVREQNHPVLFRELLSSMDVEVPDTASPEFASWQGFTEDAFRVPVFWLAISKFPNTYRAEILGLNLAMEMSGIGGSYRESIDTLKYYNFDPYFVELHDVIDNASTGHTAMAREAINLYLETARRLGGEPLVAELWDRVWTGYLSLAPQPIDTYTIPLAKRIKTKVLGR